MKNLLYLFILIILIQCNTTMNKPSIEAIDTEFNQTHEFNLQYFVISDYKTIPVDSLLEDLSSFANKNKIINLDEDQTLFFYKKKIMSDYKDKIYEAATQNEFGGIMGQENDLVAKVWYKMDKEYIQYVYIYENNKLLKKVEFKVK